ncbi:MAG: Nucleotide-binding protein [Acidimicrobiaceae bacterium]|nr:Nucleotide-binding protein [Acidimicrobiaceae bacterium]
MSEVVLVTGMSGAGRSTVSAALEDLGWFVIDNLPLALVVRVDELVADGSHDYPGIAFIVGRSGGVQPQALLGVEQELQARHDNAKILFVDAPDEVLIHRFEGNRRRHPVKAATLADSIADERAQLSTIREAAALVIDTGSINTNQLRRRIVETFSDASGRQSLRVSLVSFGYTYGIPRDVDLVFDCRFLPNPHWIDELRPLSGLDAPVAHYVLEQEPAQHFIDDVVRLLEWQIPAFALEGKSYLSIAIGCTGGRHRSVAIAEEIRRRLGIESAVFHRDLAR